MTRYGLPVLIVQLLPLWHAETTGIKKHKNEKKKGGGEKNTQILNIYKVY